MVCACVISFVEFIEEMVELLLGHADAGVGDGYHDLRLFSFGSNTDGPSLRCGVGDGVHQKIVEDLPEFVLIHQGIQMLVDGVLHEEVMDVEEVSSVLQDCVDLGEKIGWFDVQAESR
jgi:hypothetical protein